MSGRQLHKIAMELYFFAKFEGKILNVDINKAKAMFKASFLLEKAAANLLLHKKDKEPTRSVLFRSAASIAFYDCQDFEEAKELIQTGLDGNPFPEIKQELLDLQKKVLKKLKKKLPPPQIPGVISRPRG